MAELVPSSNLLAINQLKASVDRAPFIDALDAGVNWKDTTLVADFYGSAYLGSGIGLFGSSGVVYRTTDYGVTVDSITMPAGTFGAQPIRSIAYIGNGIVTAGGQGDLFRSVDYGINWTIFANITVGTLVNTMAYLGNGIVLAGDSAGDVWRSTNYGASWISVPVALVAINTMSYLENDIVIIATNDGHIWKSADSGANWTDIGLQIGGVPQCSVNIGNGIALVGSNNGHLIKTVDFGDHWSDLGAIVTNILALEYLGNGIVIAADLNGHIFRSNDFGGSWNDIGLQLSAGGIVGNLTSLKNFGDGVVLAVDTSLKLYKSDVAFKLDDSMPSVSVGMSTYGNTAGTIGLAYRELVIVGGSNVSLSQSFTRGTGTLTINANQTGNVFDLTLSGNTSGALVLVSSGTLTLAGGNNITLSQAGNAITISGGQGFRGGVSDIGNIAGTTGTVDGGGGGGGGGGFTAGVSDIGNTVGSTGPVNAQVIFAGGNNITLSQSTNGQSATITISAASVGAGSFSAGISNLGNTLGTSGTVANQLVFAGGNNITLSQSVNGQSATITMSAFNQSIQTQNIINDVNISGNTFGVTADISSGTLTLAGGNNITLSQAGNAITISAAAVGAGSFSAGVSNIGNTIGTTGTVANRIVFAGGNNITLSQSINGQSATVTISGGVAGGFSMRFFQPVPGDITTLGVSLDAGNIYFQRAFVPASISATQYDIIGQLSLASNSTGGYSFSYAIYTINGNTLSLITNSTTVAGSTFTSGSQTSASGRYAGQSARRFRSVSLNTWAFTPGDYLFALGLSTANNVSISLMGPHRISVVGIPGGGNYTKYFYDGVYSTTSNAFPSSIGLGDIIRTGDSLHIWWLGLIGT